MRQGLSEEVGSGVEYDVISEDRLVELVLRECDANGKVIPAQAAKGKRCVDHCRAAFHHHSMNCGVKEMLKQTQRQLEPLVAQWDAYERCTGEGKVIAKSREYRSHRDRGTVVQRIGGLEAECGKS
eukprot:TRINITY_DN23087_c0_g1_i1.p1 TRINITY_DN23087_c0_g1~~TRINITY_DN23087_c0_g1_i1.p1  ORF type:complete len:126 (-),score=24.93 TRINITY_DN23087_c0_g1_i1:56-433(-)